MKNQRMTTLGEMSGVGVGGGVVGVGGVVVGVVVGVILRRYEVGVIFFMSRPQRDVESDSASSGTDSRLVRGAFERRV